MNHLNTRYQRHLNLFPLSLSVSHSKLMCIHFTVTCRNYSKTYPIMNKSPIQYFVSRYSPDLVCHFIIGISLLYMYLQSEYNDSLLLIPLCSFLSHDKDARKCILKSAKQSQIQAYTLFIHKKDQFNQFKVLSVLIYIRVLISRAD